MRQTKLQLMRDAGAFLALTVAVLACQAQTLRDELRTAGIPETQFPSAELGQTVNATSARGGTTTYLAYMRVDANQHFRGSPQVLRYDSATGMIARKELPPGDEERCCGSPLNITITHNYELFEFHDTPSASTVLAADKSLKPVAVLYCFGMKEIAPDEVVFTEDMVHFAPAHPERLRVVDLRSGTTEEIYPPKGDKLRVEFARVHERKMPSQKICQAENDPCDPTYYDESVEFVSAGERQLKLRVSRDAAHVIAKDQEPETVASQEALYIYWQTVSGWRYCEMELRDKNSEDEGCVPNLPVVADVDTDETGALPIFLRKEK